MQEHAATAHPKLRERFGTFQGVFRPVFLTILGALLYLREGWLVGNAGLGGALLVIVAAYVVTGTTALSLSSIATNIRVRAGGAFAIISAALGLEAGGAIGVPLYIAQTVSSVMYLYAFTEGWGYLFPEHDPRIVVLVAFLAVGALVLRSAALAFRAQAAMLWIVGLALASAVAGLFSLEETHRPPIVARFPEASLLESFALFFPAATGIMVGAGMSGELASPRRSIPRGTMAAWAATFVIYAAAAGWYGTVAPTEELLTNKLAMVDHALVGPLVLFGLLSSTLMATLSSLVAAPRLLQAMADHDVVPLAGWLRRNTDGEPRNAVLLTMGVAALGLTAGSLDAIAPVITSFFVMTYLAVNVVVFLEQALGLVSWRPTFRVPTWVPAGGAVACVLALVLSSPAGGLPEVAFVTAIYLWLARRRKLDTPWETVQSGLAQGLAAWAALKASQWRRSERSWKPDLLVPVASAAEAEAMASVASQITWYRGSTKFVALRDEPALFEALDLAVARARAAKRFASWHDMPEDRPGQGARLSINAMQGTFFAPNLVMASPRSLGAAELQGIFDHAFARGVGSVLLLDPSDRPFPSPRTVTVWLSDRSPSWELGLHVANLDLPVLLGYLLTRSQQGTTHLATILRDPAHAEDARRFLDDLVELGRLPDAVPHVLCGTLLEHVANAPPADVHIFGLPLTIDLDRLAEIQRAAGAPCLFVRDSGHESALA